ncbi:DNA topoisomerase IV [Cellvibrio sp. KY-GH-1]|uniref:porin n=1 Tax=Cellvibrio sp. KY-GH-1 TaxID=2303332 RepID=UPI0012468AC4|nr:porin [Cellvibrio sp. KY-GH-1]QEY16681.1 DNA topoisomerase IV [Cellvibrio sp. KY-GH-1]
MKKISLNRKKNHLAWAIALLMSAHFANASDVTISGFLSVGGGMVDDEDSIPYGGYDEEDLTFDRNLLGLQVSGQVSEKVTATAQLIARSGDDYQVNSEWAYLTWQASDAIKVRAGRLRTPFYMYSDFLDVGYSYAWITPPQEVYYLPFNNVDGVDVYFTGTLGIFDTSLQAYFGSFTDDLVLNGARADAQTRNQMGVSGTVGKDWWTLRAAYHQADLTVDVTGTPISPTTTLGGFANTLSALGFGANADRLLVEEDDASFAEVGINIDTGRFVAAAEHVEFDPGDAVLSKNIREYVMVGVRAGDWLFHVTAAKAKDEATHPESGIPANQPLPVVGSTNVLIGTLKAIAESQVNERDVLSFGTRWDVTTGTAIKFQFDDVDDLDGDQKVYSVALQTVF